MENLFISKISFTEVPSFLSSNNVDQQHKFVMSLFETGENTINFRSKNNILFSTENKMNQNIVFYVQSVIKPNIDYLKNKSIKKDVILETKNVSKIYNEILEGGHFSYKIKVNPVVFSRGKRKPVRGEENIFQWWKEKAKKENFIIDETKTSVIIEQNLKNTKTKNTISTVTITGIAEVIDKKMLFENLKQGIGKSKSYGYGMLFLGKAN